MAKKKTARKKTVKKKTAPRKKKAAAGKKRGGGLTQMSYSLSPELQAVVGVRSATRPQVVKKLWAYIKTNKCQDTTNRRMIVPNEKLAAVFGSKRPVDMLKMSGLLNKHIKK
jgi:chromatin remodeling complex protein RSC6